MAELVACPECKKHLQVPDELLGKKVQCPECKHTFAADPANPEEAEAKTFTTASRSGAPKKPAWEKMSSSSSSKKKKKRNDEDDDDEYEVDDENYRPPRRRGRSSINRSNLTPHRGGMILAFGIISLVGGHALCFPFIFGPIAWFMGTGDLQAIREGRMDPEGEGLTQVGRILGMIASILTIVYVLGVCAYFVFVFLIFGLFVGAAANANKNFPPRKF